MSRLSDHARLPPAISRPGSMDSLESAAAQTWDALVLGAGPAGSMAARELARRGARVLMIDRRAFPRDKVCGACLNGRALSLLKRAGLDDFAIAPRAVALTELRLFAAGRHVTLPLSRGAVISRSRLDAGLAEAAVAAGAVFLPETAGLPIDVDDASRSVLLQRNGERVIAAARIVVVAGGLGSAALLREDAVRDVTSELSWIGAGGTAPNFPSDVPSGAIHMAVGRDGYVGLVRQEDGSLNVAAALARDFLKAHGPAAAAEAVFREAGFPMNPGMLSFDWQGTLPLTRRTAPIAAHRAFVIGDAAGYVEPFTGEGIAWALASGAAVAPFALSGCREWNAGLCRKWTAVHRKTVLRRQQWCRLVAAVLHRPWLVHAAIRVLGAMPWLASPVIRRMHEGR